MANYPIRTAVFHLYVHVHRDAPLYVRSSQRKLTRLIHNILAFHHLHQMCDNQHELETWGQKPDGSWATSEETAYTHGLLPAPLPHKSLFSSKRKDSSVIYPVLQNRNAHSKPCVLPQTFSHARISAGV